MRGDVSGCLIESVETRVMNRELSAAALLIAAQWNQEHGRDHRHKSYNDANIDVTEGRERYHRRLMRPTMYCGTDEMDQD